MNQRQKQLEEKVAELEREVADRQQLEDALRESEQRYRTLFESIPLGIVLAALSGRVLTSNEAMLQLTRYSAAEIKCINLRDIYQYPEDWIALLAQLDRDGLVRNFETTLKHKDGSSYWVSMSVTPITLDGEEVLLTTVRDITTRVRAEEELKGYRDHLEELVAARTAELQQEIEERRRVEEALRVNEERYRNYFALPLIGFAITSVDKRWLEVNDKLCDILGYPREKLTQLTWSEMTHPDDLAENLASFERVLNGEADGYSMEKRFIRQDGVIIDAEVSARCVRGQDGLIDYFVASVQDITERKQAEESLNTSLQIAADIVQAIPAGLFIYQFQAPDRLFLVDANPEAERLTGITLEEWAGQEFNQIWPEARATGVTQAYLDVMKSGKIFETEDLYYADDRIQGAFRIRAFPMPGYRLGVAFENTTERRQAEEALKRSEATLRSIFRAAPVGIGLVSNRVFQWTNDTLNQMIGYSADELVGQSARILYESDEEFERVGREKYAEIARWGTGSIETRFKRKDGGIIEILLSSTPLDPDDLSIGVTFTALDITERKRTEESNTRLGRILDDSFNEIYVFDAETLRFIQVNRGARGNLGYSEAELQELTPLDLKPEFTPEMFANLLQPLRDGHKDTIHFNTVHRRKDGTLYPVEVHLQLSYFETLPVFVAIILDVTERKQAEDEIRRRNRELTLLNRVIEASAADQEPEKVLSIACRELALAFDVPQAVAALLNEDRTEAVVVADYVAQGHPSVLNLKISIAKNPPLQQLLNNKRPLVVDDLPGDPRFVPLHDLIDRRRIASLLLLPLIIEDTVVGSLSLNSVEPRRFSEVEIDLAWNVAGQVGGSLARARLTETRRRLMTAIEQTPDSVVITDTDGTIIYVNPAFERVSGYSRTEAIGQNPRLLKSGHHDAAFYEDFWATISGGDVWQGQLVNKKKDGVLYTEETIITPVRGEQGTIVNYIAIKRDVTQELQLEEQYRQAQRLESIGRLAGGVAHDFNNILTVITGYSELLLSQYYSPGDPRREEVEQIKQAAERAGMLTRQLLAFSRQQRLKPQIFNLNDVVINLEKMLRRLIGEDVVLITKLTPDLGSVKADPGQMEQVLMNLAVNARDAMPRGGQLILETANITLDQSEPLSTPLPPGSYVMLTVTDTGVGMDADTQARVFEPFFTTKEMGKGTGLGLSTVYGIVQQSNGQIQVESILGQGTTFRIYLPQIEPTAESALLPAAAVTSMMGQETILVVEDEVSVRLVTRRILELRGYTVLEAGNPRAALNLCRQYQGQVDLLITDVIMPDLSGPELAERLMVSYPDLKVLFVSGYTNDVLDEYGIFGQDIVLLEKPFTPDGLTRKVRETLDSS